MLLALLAGHADALYDPAQKIESARIYGNIGDYAYYFVDILVGTPPQRVSVILDTGSGIIAFPCASCSHCGSHIDAAFDLSRSSTAVWQPCGSECVGSCSGARCAYHQGYVEGSAVNGYWFQDFVAIGDTIQQNPAVSGRMGCHEDENKLFYTQEANGILGIGPRSRQGRTLLQELYKDTTHVRSSIFAICLSEEGGQLTVGGHNASFHTGPVQHLDLDMRLNSYGVALHAMELGGRVIHADFGRTIIDSGTTYTYLSTAAYRALRGGIESHCRGAGDCGAAHGGNCWTVPGGEAGLGRFPTVDTVFGSVRAAWVPQAYLYRSRKGGSRWCYAFFDDGPKSKTVLGASWMLHKDVVFDVESAKVGLAPATCPRYVERPPPPNMGAGPGSPPWVAALAFASGLALWGWACSCYTPARARDAAQRESARGGHKFGASEPPPPRVVYGRVTVDEAPRCARGSQRPPGGQSDRRQDDRRRASSAHGSQRPPRGQSDRRQDDRRRASSGHRGQRDGGLYQGGPFLV